MRVPDVGGEPERLTSLDLDQGETRHRWPEVLPNGTGALFATSDSEEDGRIAFVSYGTGEVTDLGLLGTFPHYAPTGHLVYGLDDTFWAVGFAQDRLVLTVPTPVPVMQDVNTNTVVGSAAIGNFSLSDDGSLVYLPWWDSRAQDRTLVWVDHDGRDEPVAAAPGVYQEFSLSPDGTQVAVVVGGYLTGVDADVWILDLEWQAQPTDVRSGNEGESPDLDTGWPESGSRGVEEWIVLEARRWHRDGRVAHR